MTSAFIRKYYVSRTVHRLVLNRPNLFLHHRVISRASVSTEPTPKKGDVKEPTWELRLLYDGECPLCLREIGMLRSRDEKEKRIDFVNIASEAYKPDENQGITYGRAMGRIQAILPNGTVIEGVEVFRRCYEIVGLGWVYAMTKMKPIERVVNVVYDVWARWRLPLTGRSNEGIEAKILWKEEFDSCENSEVCELPWSDDEEDEDAETKTAGKEDKAETASMHHS